jgi:histone H3/H4
MPHTPIPRGTARKLTRLVIIGMLVQASVVFYVGVSGYIGRKDLVRTQRAGCERGKKDRLDNAAFQRAHKKYISRVVLAKSVQKDVKDAAREAIKVYTKTAADLTKRSKIDCSVAYPKARLLP